MSHVFSCYLVSGYNQLQINFPINDALILNLFDDHSAQREGLLSEAHSEEVDQADPFYAHCKLHSDKTLVRKRRRNWLALQLRATNRLQMLKTPEYRETEEFLRIQRKLAKHRHKYLAHKSTKPPPWGNDIFKLKINVLPGLFKQCFR